LVAIIAPNLTKYLGKSKTNTDKKNVDEIASQLKTCITDYETEYGDLIAANGGALAVTWSSTGVTCTNANFKTIVENTIGTSAQSKKDTTKYASASIALKNAANGADDGYTITVTLNTESVVR
jgi:hypothetical protein